MSALRAASRSTRFLIPSLSRQGRLASTAAHDPHHPQHNEHDSNLYPKETFFTPFWRRTILVTLGLIAYAKFAPADFKKGEPLPNGEYEPPWFTRVLAYYAPSVEQFTKTNEQHLLQTEDKAQFTLALQSAKAPVMPMRNKRPRFEQSSPHRVPVGGVPDLSDLVVKP